MPTNRRTFLKSAAAAGGTAVLLTQAIPVEAQPAPPARFGELFPNLPEYLVPDAALSALAETMRDRAAGSPLGDNLFYDGTTLTDAYPAGLTYVGQFLDHDMTLDRTLLIEAGGTPTRATRNGRAIAINLDSVYEGAPRDGNKLRLVVNEFGVLDAPRDEQGFAILGDFRNDENLVLLPVHLGIMRFHNALLDKGMAATFERAQELTRWHYQWVIAREFLPATIGTALANDIMPFDAAGNPTVNTKFYNRGLARTTMPIEFAVGCYRLHTLIRNNYNIRSGTRVGIFNTQPLNLVGGRPVPPELVQQSDMFFRAPTSPPFDPPNTQAGPLSFNVARRFDASISPQLFNLPAFALPSNPEFNNLPVRNLIRGSRLGMAAGQDVARAMGVTPLTNAELNVNAANVAGGTHGVTDPVFQDKVPLWFYFNKEADLLTGGRRLGPVGGRIVGEVIAGLLDSDLTSFVNKDFVPTTPIAPARGQFTFADLLRFAGAI
jgi:hypothetical protein